MKCGKWRYSINLVHFLLTVDMVFVLNFFISLICVCVLTTTLLFIGIHKLIKLTNPKSASFCYCIDELITPFYLSYLVPIILTNQGMTFLRLTVFRKFWPLIWIEYTPDVTRKINNRSTFIKLKILHCF